MGNRGSDDLDWLYRRGNCSGEPEWEPVVDHAPPPPPVYAAPPPQSPYPPPPPAYAAPPPRPGRRRRHPIRSTVVVVLALSLAYLVLVPVVAWSRGARVDAMPDGARPPQHPGRLYLLTGSDSRENLSAADRARLGTGSTAGRRTDTIMMLYLPPRGRTVLLSVPRDSYLKIPGHGRNKINAAYSIGGPKLLAQALEERTGLHFDGYVEIGLGGFVNVIDAVGGVDVCLDKPIKDRDSHLDLPAGCQHFDGVTALNYARMRKADPEGDLGRMKRQREIMGLAVRKAASPVSILNPVQYWQLNHAGSQAVVTGTNTGVLDMTRLVMGMISVSSGDAITLTVPVADANRMTAAGSSIIWDDKAADALFAEMARGDTSQVARFKK